ncbi:hypothetical protein FRC09_019433 [Ceratobasidium sp. 395]|nr:hypothetical protein FRC09_019433 [Ceratobasidium sp. 395]
MSHTNGNQHDNTDNNETSWDQASTIVSDSGSVLSALTSAQTHSRTSMSYLNTEGYTETGTDGRLSPAPSIYSLTESLRDQSFRHVHGRSLNAHSDVYSLPADEEEAERLYKQHRMFYHLARDDNYYGLSATVKEVLAPTPQRQRAVLDLGCGPGAWTIQCADDFPHAEVLGVDLAPTSAIAPPPNCRFEIDDLNLGLEHFFGDTFDLVHARLLNSGVKDYAGLVDQVSRCVRPGGLVMFTEVDFRCWSEDKRLLITPNFYTPLPSQGRPSLGLASNASSKSGGSSSSSASSSAKSQHLTRLTDWAVPTWLAMMSKCVRAKGGNIDSAALLKTWMREHPNYEEVETKDLWTPLGPWKPTILDEWSTHPNFAICGKMCQENFANLMKGARPLLYSFLSEQEVAELEGNAVRELMEANNPILIRVQCTSARKKRAKV